MSVGWAATNMGETYRVVKFSVRVRLMENRVNNHVGRVIVVKVMSHRRATGRKVKIEMRACPKPEDFPTCTACSVVLFIVEARCAEKREGGDESIPLAPVTEGPRVSMTFVTRKYHDV